MALPSLPGTKALAAYARFTSIRYPSYVERARKFMTTTVSEKTTSHWRSLIQSFSSKRILVVGDMVADEYLIGNPKRISREAPVLILDLDEERVVPGGATNVAVNARTL